ncbi:thioesterase domain-containing protein [Hoeflea sp. BAL378]|uniref:thioesterase domain-containing protein n=1 Tax=Hoeflea sp. BAL378 TaxID=1547437 RepID=UPI00068A6CD8|nr:thioesterase domain-containing protein [Hoeflea sp. BAL378]
MTAFPISSLRLWRLSRAPGAAILLLLALILPVPSPATAAAKPAGEPATQVYFIRGFLGVFSTGFDEMARTLARDRIRAEVYGHLSGATVRAKIVSQWRQSKKPRPVVLVGHSFGGNAVFEIASLLAKDNIPVALVISVDPTRAGPLSANVKKYVNYYFPGNGLGSELKPRSGVAPSRISNIDMRKRADVAGAGDDHWTVTHNGALQAEILKAVKRAAR